MKKKIVITTVGSFTILFTIIYLIFLTHFTFTH